MLRFLLCTLTASFLCVSPSLPLQADDPVRVMSFNLRYGNAKDGENRWEKRKDLVAETIETYSPDLLGTQETLAFQAEFLQQQLKEYDYFGRSRMKTPNEHCGIFFRSSRFTKLAGGHFWLSETPEIPASKSWDSSLPRMATWVLLSDRKAESSPTILFVNTHFDHRGQVARTKSAELIRKRIGKLHQIAENTRVVLTGDFNAPEQSDPYQALVRSNGDATSNDGKLIDTYRKISPERNPNEGTFGGFTGKTKGGRIDWILVSQAWEIEEAGIDHMSDGQRFPSDHYPVTATLRFGR